MIIAYLLLTFGMAGGALGLYKSTDRVNVAVRRLCGGKRVFIQVRRGGELGDHWYAIVETTPLGDMIAYRYPSTRSGVVTLHENGTGYYHGDVEWVEA